MWQFTADGVSVDYSNGAGLPVPWSSLKNITLITKLGTNITNISKFVVRGIAYNLNTTRTKGAVRVTHPAPVNNNNYWTVDFIAPDNWLPSISNCTIDEAVSALEAKVKQYPLATWDDAIALINSKVSISVWISEDCEIVVKGGRYPVVPPQNGATHTFIGLVKFAAACLNEEAKSDIVIDRLNGLELGLIVPIGTSRVDYVSLCIRE